jgi:hypothetical protein
LLLNELAQWAVLVFLAIFVFGLTRQLGVYLVPQKQQLLDAGPAIGKRLPDVLVADGRGDTLSRLARSSADATVAAIFVLEEDCPGCRGLVVEMEEENVTAGMPMVALLKGDQSSEFAGAVRNAFAVVIEDEGGDLARGAGIDGTPFLLVVDDQLVLRHKDWAGDLFQSATTWLAGTRSEGNGAAAPPAGERLSVREVHR